VPARLRLLVVAAELLELALACRVVHVAVAGERIAVVSTD